MIRAHPYGTTVLHDLEAPAGLTQRQRAAVAFRGGNLLVEAVPGSGKTRVIVARCEALLAEGVAAAEILLLTFSRRAVGELRARLLQVLAPDALPDIRTFHGFAARLLANAGDAGASGRLLSEPAERALFETVVATTPLPSLPPGVAGSALFRETASARVDEIRRSSPAAIARLADGATPRLADLLALEANQRRLRARLGAADYDDLVARAVDLARAPGGAVANALRGRYRHVLVDEFQDTDPLQLALLERFGAEIFAVGDAGQAIYGFRGAARHAMQRARSVLAMTPVALDESFRCPEIICELARSVAAPQSRGLRSRSAEAGTLLFRRAASPQDEAAFIGEQIAAAMRGGTPEREIAVLVRSAEPLAPLVARELRARHRGNAARRRERARRSRGRRDLHRPQSARASGGARVLGAVTRAPRLRDRAAGVTTCTHEGAAARCRRCVRASRAVANARARFGRAAGGGVTLRARALGRESAGARRTRLRRRGKCARVRDRGR